MKALNTSAQKGSTFTGTFPKAPTPFDQLNHRGYELNSCGAVQVVHPERNDKEELGGLCGAMSGIETPRLPLFVKRAFQRLLCRQDEVSQPVSSPSFHSMMDSFQDGSTARCVDIWKEYGDSMTSASTSDSEEEMVREENRRWRRGF